VRKAILIAACVAVRLAAQDRIIPSDSDSTVRHNYPMRDGKALAADVYRREAPDATPVILIQTPTTRADAPWRPRRSVTTKGVVCVR